MSTLQADARPPRVVKAAQAVKNAKEAGGASGGTAPRVEIGDLRALGNQGKKSTGFGGMGVGRNIVEQHEAEGGRRRLNQDGAKKEDGAVPQHINIDHAGGTWGGHSLVWVVSFICFPSNWESLCSGMGVL